MVVGEPRPDVAGNLARVLDAIERASARAGRAAGSVALVAVTKTQPVHVVEAAIAAGARTLGENRVQEAAEKVGCVAGDGVSWHLIGSLQTNKVKRALQLFDLIHAVDSELLAREIASRAAGPRRFPVLLQVNVAREASKHGFSPEEALEAAPRIAGLPGIRIAGLMAIAPLDPDPEASRPWYRRLRELRERLRREAPAADWRELSMGMSHDYEVAIEEGATMVRVGSAIFGPRA